MLSCLVSEAGKSVHTAEQACQAETRRKERRDQRRQEEEVQEDGHRDGQQSERHQTDADEIC